MDTIPVEAPKCLEDKMAVMNTVVTKVNKQYGAGSMRRMGSNEIVVVPSIPTGLMDLDHRVLGIGGFPRGRFTEIYGPESSGKTTLALQVAANAQKAGGLVGYIDAEHALDPVYAQQLGVNMDDVFLTQPDYGEQALDIAEQIIETGGCDVLVIDSVAALIPKAELDGEMEDQQMGLHARLMAKACRKLLGVTRKSSAVVIWINQIRSKIGVMYGNPETTTGGHSLRFAASIRLRMSQTGKVSTDGLRKNTQFKCEKNKLSTPFRECKADVVFGAGFDSLSSTVDLAIDTGAVESKGAWCWFDGERVSNGKDKLKELCSADEALYAKIQAKLAIKLKEPEAA